jgi:hypothetical protein
MENKQTAVEWLAEKLNEVNGEDNPWFDIPLAVLEKAKQMERDQLNKACYDGYYREDLYDTRNYYKDTYCEYSGLPSVESYEDPNK